MEILKGASWFRTVAVLSLINIVASFFDRVFIFGLGSTQLLQEAITSDFINPFLGGFCMFLIPAFFLLTWRLSEEGYRFAYNIGFTVYLLDLVLLIYMLAKDYGAETLIIDIVLHVAVLLFGFKIFKINSRGSISRTFPWGIQKNGFLLAAVITVAITIYSFGLIINKVTSNKETFMELLNENLPAEVCKGLFIQQVVENDGTLGFVYQYENVYLSECDADDISEYIKVSKHEMLFDISVNPDLKNIITCCLEYGFAVVRIFNDAKSNKMYEVAITAEELNSIATEDVYMCPKSDVLSIVKRHKEQMPYKYVSGMTLNNLYLSKENILVYEVKLPPMYSKDHASITQSYVKDCFMTNIPAPVALIMRLAFINQITVCFDVRTFYDTEYTKVYITPEIYLSMLK